VPPLWGIVILGIDAHKQTHTVVLVDDCGRKLGERTVKTTTQDHLDLLVWAARFGAERRWAFEDCRTCHAGSERDLFGAGQQVVRIPPTLMANARTPGRSYGKSDPIGTLGMQPFVPVREWILRGDRSPGRPSGRRRDGLQ
jgi:transposase